MIALDAKGIAQSHITATHAARLLEETAHIAAQDHTAEEGDTSTMCEDAAVHNSATAMH